MPDPDTLAIGQALTELVEVIAEVDINVAAIDERAADYARTWARVNGSLRKVPIDNPLAEFPTLWDWYGRCQDDLSSALARRHHLAEVRARIGAVFEAASFPEPSYTIEMFERDSGEAPYLTWFLHDLSRSKQLAAKAGVERILAYLGSDIVSTEWGDNIGDGVFELRIRRTAAEVEAWWRDHYGLPQPEPEPHEEILLRIWFHPYGDRRILLLRGFDKGAQPNREQAEIVEAKASLRSWRQGRDRLRAR